MIRTADVLDVAVVSEANQVPGAIHPRPRLRGEGIRDEPLSGLVCSIEIAPRDPDAAEMQLPDLAHRDGLPLLVEHVGPVIGERTPDVQRLVRRPFGLHERLGRAHGVLGRTVLIVQRASETTREAVFAACRHP